MQCRHSSKEDNWLRQVAKEAELILDEEIERENGTQKERSHENIKQKKIIAQLKANLDKLLDEPLNWTDGPTGGIAGRKGLVVVAR